MAGEKAAEVTPEETFNDDFETAFLDAVDDKKPEETADSLEDKTDDKKADDGATGDPAPEVSDGDVPKGDDKPVEPPVSQPVESPEIAALRAELEELKKQQTKPAVQEPSAEEKKAIEEKQKGEEWYGKEFAEDWPDIKRAVDHVAAQLRNEISSQIQALAKNLSPYVQQTAASTFITELRTIHTDFDTVRDGFIEWVKKQPEAISAAYTNVIEKGTAKDVGALITIYKDTVKPTQQPTTKTPVNEDRLRKMEDVGSRESATSHEVDATDFDGAFGEALKTVV